MKKVLALALVFAGLLPSAAMAKGSHPMAGCGLAYMLFAKDNNSKGIQILASTTNNIYGTQSFGITSGTSGCTEDGMMAKNAEAEVYAEINLRELSRDMSKGEGEYLAAFSGLIGVDEGKKAEFFQLVQSKYTTLFPSADTTSTQMLERLSNELSKTDLLG